MEIGKILFILIILSLPLPFGDLMSRAQLNYWDNFNPTPLVGILIAVIVITKCF